MKKTIRTLSLILAHVGLLVSIVYLVLCVIGHFVPAVANFARIDFFGFDYFYLVIPGLVLISGILLQIAVMKSKKRKSKAKSSPNE